MNNNIVQNTHACLRQNTAQLVEIQNAMIEVTKLPTSFCSHRSRRVHAIPAAHSSNLCIDHVIVMYCILVHFPWQLQLGNVAKMKTQ